MNGQDIVALVIVAAALLFAGRSLWRNFSGKGPACSCGFKTKSCGANRGPSSQPPGLTRQALVTPDQIGKPPSEASRKA